MEEYVGQVERRKGHREIVALINRRYNDLERRMGRFVAKALIAFTIIGIACAGSLAGFGYILKEQAEVSDEIQQQRYDTIYTNCIQQNLRHDEAVKLAANIFGQSPNRLANTTRLIGALQPYVKDCAKYTELRVKEFE